MLIAEKEDALRKKFPFPFEFRESRVADLESNLFFVLAQKEKKNPKDLAKKYLPEIERLLWPLGVEFRNGFLNIYFTPEALKEELVRVLKLKKKFFCGKEWKGKKVNLEFVSANPTGPLHLGNIRGGPLGAVLAEVLKLRGAEVKKEYYVNDYGTQTEKFVATVIYWLVRDEELVPFPEEGYQGEYPKDLAQKLGRNAEVKKLVESFKAKKASYEELQKKLTPKIVALALEDIKKTLSRIGVEFDHFVFESSLLRKAKEVLEELKKKGYVQQKEGAWWFVSKEHRELLGDRECV
ncbi:arginine--tRNA ligase, partial [bacterium]|nr:arginine--tRNA ligase [bacterium]